MLTPFTIFILPADSEKGEEIFIHDYPIITHDQYRGSSAPFPQQTSVVAGPSTYQKP
jgi:hypothetical protein